MSELAYIYLLQDGLYKGTNVYKIGRTVQKGGDGRKLKRLQGYSKGTVPYNTWKVNEDNLNAIEKKIKEAFQESYRLVRGTEWFEGDVKQMKKDIDDIIEEMDIDEASDCESDDSVCIACNGSGISYWSDDIYGECLECGGNAKEEINVGGTHLSRVEEVLRCDDVTKYDKQGLLYVVKRVNDNQNFTSLPWNCKLGTKYYQYLVDRNRKLVLSQENRIVIPHVKATIIVDTKEKGGHVTFEKYIKFKYLCSGNCKHCMNTRIQYQYMDEDSEYAHCSCVHCYDGHDWENDMFCFFTK